VTPAGTGRGPASDDAGDVDDVREDDIAAATPSLMAKAAGGALGGAGLVATFVAAQFLTSLRIRGWPFYVLVGLGGVGLLALVLGVMVLRARDWAASSGLVVGPVLAILGITWVVVAFMNGVFSLLAVMSVGAALLASVLVPIALKDCERASDARRALAKAGLDLGT